MRSAAVAVMLLLAVSISAAPTVTAITPNTGPATGGTIVTIHGSGFSSCPLCSPPLPPRVYFGGVEVRAYGLWDGNTVRVEAPPHLPGTLDVLVEQWDGEVLLEDAFTYTGSVEEAFHRILLPLFVPPIPGAFGSEFHTQLVIASSRRWPTTIFGLERPCLDSACVRPDNREVPYLARNAGIIYPAEVAYTGNPGRFIYIARSEPDLFAYLRVFDVSTRTLNFGTEIPVVRDVHFVRGPINIPGVPLDPRFRRMLRIYAVEPMTVMVTVAGRAQAVTLTSGGDMFEPAYGSFSDFPTGTGFPLLTITQVVPAGVEPRPMWAFVTVTNNETQMITTISPTR